MADTINDAQQYWSDGRPVEEEKQSESRTLFGTLEVQGDDTYYVFLKQSRLQKIWVLTRRDIYDIQNKDERQKAIVALLKVKSSGALEGLGKTFILTRLMSNISAMVYKATIGKEINNGFGMTCEYTEQSTGSYISFKTLPSGRTYMELNLAYEGFLLSLNPIRRGIPFSIPTHLETVHDSGTKAAVVTNLGIRTAAALFARMGERLDWYKSKDYQLISSVDKFRRVMLDFLNDVQRAAYNNRTVVVGLDTETTGLNVVHLSEDNPLRDTIVAIPFGWEDNKAYVICTDMYYFSNVEDDELYPLFNILFRRNPDYTFQDIKIDYQGQHFEFNRMNITVAGFNTMFDQMAFLNHDCDVFFDEDVRQLFFNLNTDLQQGQLGFKEEGTFRISNSLKSQTRRNIGDETLELQELFGKGHEDKYRYLQDPQLAELYGGADADYTRATLKIAKALTEKGLYAQYRKYDMTTAYQMGRAAWNGMPIDTEAVKAQGELVQKDLETLQNFIYHYAWLANRDSLQGKAERMAEMLGVDTPVEVQACMEKDQLFRYPFTPRNHKKLLFELLGYPVVRRATKTGEPALDKFVLDKLIAPKRDTPVEVMQEDILSQSDPGAVLVSKDDFNKDAFPLARVFKTYATLNKEYTSYYKPILDNDMEGKMFYNITLARAATRRILSPGQTMKGSLKTLVVAPPGKIFMSFDASQIEYRHMASLAYIRAKKILQDKYPDSWEARLNETSVATVFHMMHKEEADYHIETAASMTGCRQHEVTKKTRKKYKSIGFGIPYGLSDRSLCETLHGVVNDETMRETRATLDDYKKKQKEVMDLLESVRDSAFVPANISPELREYLKVGDSHVGIVRNFAGFYRLFILENLTRARTGRIRRQAGNCIIQGGAAELFRRMLYNFHIGCCKYGIQDKIQWVMTVHDELDAVIDGDIDIVLLIKVIYENCTLRYTDHIPYYVGINFGPNWGEAKDDANELPTIMVQRMIAAYDAGKFSLPKDGHQAEYLLTLKRHYLCDRIGEELEKIVPGLTTGHQWTDEEIARVDNEFANYVVRAYLDVFSPKGADLRGKLEGWQKAREEYGFGVSFLTETFDGSTSVGVDVDLGDFDLGDMALDLLDDEDAILDGIIEEETNGWFNEASLFDHSLSADEIVADVGDTNYSYEKSENFEDQFTLNDHPTNSFDVFLANKYVRSKVFKVQDGVYSVLLAGTEYNGQEKNVMSMIKGHFMQGSDTLVLVGQTTLGTKKLSCSEEDLDWLDKKLTGRE